MTTGTVGEFIRTAFPRGNFPIPDDKTIALWPSLDDYSYNYAGWLKKKEQKSFEPADQGPWAVPPLWPPDAFAFSAHLLEQSGAYLRMAYLGEAISDEAVRGTVSTGLGDVPVDVSRFLELADVGKGKMPESLSVPDGLLKVCRIVGSLWFEGALFISWPEKDILRLEQNWKDAVVATCVESTRDGIKHIKHRYSDEFRPDEVDRIIENAIASFLVKHPIRKPYGIRIKNKSLVNFSTSLQKIIVEEVNRIAKDEKFTGNLDLEKIDKISSENNEIIIELLLALWALDFLQSLWNAVSERQDLKVATHEPSQRDWSLWRALTLLLITADEAGKTIGFSLRPSEGSRTNDSSRVKKLIQAAVEQGVEKENAERDVSDADGIVKSGQRVGLSCRDIWLAYALGLKDKTKAGAKDHPRTVAKAFNDNLGSVLPKARTAPLGCTIRSLSLNLALLPPKGRVRARWAQQGSVKLQNAFNILLIPFPYNIHTKDVVPLKSDLADDKKWGRFDIKPGWMKQRYDPVTNKETGEASGEVDNQVVIDEVVDDEERLAKVEPEDYRFALWRFIKSLIDDQPKDVINALILPEASIDYACYEYIKYKIKMEEDYSSISLIVCGLNSNGVGKNKKNGNFVATALRDCEQDGKKCAGWAVQDIRAKHHRWSLNKDQLQTYALSNTLEPNRIWWENIDIPPREMFFAEFTCGSILTSLICEDLARIEPCQIALRAVGPNLTIVLLMDSAQIVGRWPAQYAGVLSDDPGTSVLTLTSFGLINRANLSEGHEGRSIALWREPHGRPAMPINLGKGFDAQLLTIRRDTVRETTLDGRGDNGDCAVVWRHSGLVPIKAKIPPPGGRPSS